MIENPSASELLGAMERTLTRDVLPACSGSAKHAARVVANLCAVLEREADDGAGVVGEARSALGELLDADGELSELVDLLDKRLADDDPDFDARARPVLMADTRRRLAIAKPGYAVTPGYK